MVQEEEVLQEEPQAREVKEETETEAKMWMRRMGGAEGAKRVALLEVEERRRWCRRRCWKGAGGVCWCSCGPRRPQSGKLSTAL